MARFGASELLVNGLEFGIATRQGGRNHAQPLAATSFHDSGYEQPVHEQRIRAGTRTAEQRVDIIVAVVATEAETAPCEHAVHDMKVLELLAREGDERLEQTLAIGVTNHEHHPRG